MIKKSLRKYGEEMMDENVLEQLIGCWQSEGWDFIFGEQVELIPYVSKVLTDIGAEDMLAAF
ncbi:MAG: hypothetical protein K6B68_14795, partial [Eubacterium sp.]|nr:hypothetical protein [Eubacterium sp.]